MALGGLSAKPVGNAQQVADLFEKWFAKGGCGGFHMSCKWNFALTGGFC
jgi:hypothetical protein